MNAGTPDSRLSAPTLDALRAAFPTFPGWTRDTEWTELVSADERDADLVELDQIDLKFGMGATYDDGPVKAERRSFSRAWLRSITGIAPRHLVWALGDGTSMEPTIRSGEVILIDRSQTTPHVNDEIWAVSYADTVQIKRLRQLPDGSVQMHCDSQIIPPITAVDDEMRIIGRVIAVVRRL